MKYFLLSILLIIININIVNAKEIQCKAIQEFSCDFTNNDQLDCDLVTHEDHMYSYTINKNKKSITIAAGERIFTGSIRSIASDDVNGSMYIAEIKDSIQESGEDYSTVISIVKDKKIIVHNIDSVIYGYCQ